MSDHPNVPPVMPGQRGAGGDFERDVLLDKPGIVGARWWHKSLVQGGGGGVPRRNMLKGLAVAGGVFGAMAVAGFGISKLVGGPKEHLSTRSSLEMQKLYGWDFGARGTPLVFNGVSQAPFVRQNLVDLGKVMTPITHSRYYVGTLPAALTAWPALNLPDPPDGKPRAPSAPFQSLADIIVPIVTPAMERAYRSGEALARLASGKQQRMAVLADLPGPEAVAFAAGASSYFEPVLLFDNWPHPKGVVPSHLSLAALAYYQPRFAEQASARTSSQPLFLLDRYRLAPYSEETDRFDNRYYAKMPTLAALGRSEIQNLLYVVATPSQLPEPDDLNGILSAPPTATDPVVDVRAISLSEFDSTSPGQSPDQPAGPAFYGGSAETDESFWANYPSIDPTAARTVRTVAPSTTKDHRFAARPAAVTTPPEDFATVPVLIGASGLLMAAALGRRGSRNRFSSSSGG